MKFEFSLMIRHSPTAMRYVFETKINLLVYIYIYNRKLIITETEAETLAIKLTFHFNYTSQISLTKQIYLK